MKYMYIIFCNKLKKIKYWEKFFNRMINYLFITIVFFFIFSISETMNLYSAENEITMKTEMITSVKSWNTEIDQNIEVPEMEYYNYNITVESVTADTTVYIGHIHSVEMVINSNETENISDVPFGIYFGQCIDDDCTTSKEFFGGTFTIPILTPGVNTCKVKFIVPKINGQSGEYNLICALYTKDLKNIIDGIITDNELINQIYSKASVKINLDASNILKLTDFKRPIN